MRAPIPPNEQQRLQALRECCVLDTQPEEGFDQITAMAADIASTPIALISLVDADRQWFKSRVGLSAEETPRDLAFCAHAILSSCPLIVDDARLDERFRDNPLVTGPPKIRFYAGFPLELSSGEKLGTLCVIDVRPRALEEKHVRLLTRLSREAAASLELRRSLEQLSQTNRQRDELITQLRETQRQLDSASRAKSEFLANMSHEIRTPMSAILGYLDLLEEPDQSQEQQLDHLGTIRRNACHLLTIINDILDLSKIEARKMTVEAIETSPIAIIGEVETLLAPRASDKELTLRVDLATALPRAIRSDPVRLRQILMNLVSNAIKFTDAGCVTVRAALDRGERPALRIDVEDTGIGIGPEEQSRLFGAFEQGDASTTRRFGGTGLGLQISRRLAELLGGTITLASRPGSGSVFTLQLPADMVDQAGLVMPEDAEPSAAVVGGTSGEGTRPAPVSLAGSRILLAEDGPDNQRLIGFHVTKAGATLTIVDNGAQAVEAVEKSIQCDAPFDLVLMDMQMVEMDGYEATRVLRERGHALPVIALTAHAMTGDREKCIDAGCDEYLSKPVDRHELIRCCAALLANAPAR